MINNVKGLIIKSVMEVKQLEIFERALHRNETEPWG